MCDAPPPRPPPQDTLLSARLKAGEGQFKSDNVSTLAILKDFLTRQATNRKMQVKSPFEVRDETCVTVLQLLHPRLEYQLQLSEKVRPRGSRTPGLRWRSIRVSQT